MTSARLQPQRGRGFDRRERHLNRAVREMQAGLPQLLRTQTARQTAKQTPVNIELFVDRSKGHLLLSVRFKRNNVNPRKHVQRKLQLKLELHE